jgi:hypothetical protein
MRYSIIVPHCTGQQESATQRKELQSVVGRLQVGHELLSNFTNCPTIDHAIVAGVRAARGEAVVIIEPGDRYPMKQLPELLRGLSRADFVCGRRRRRGWPKLAERIGRLPRWLFLGLDSRDPDCLFWAARREVFNGLQLLPRLVRYLPTLVARQGFRVDSVYVEERQVPHVRAGATLTIHPASGARVAPANLLSAWRTCRKVRDPEAGAAAASQSPAGPGAAAEKPSKAHSSVSPSEPYRARSA